MADAYFEIDEYLWFDETIQGNVNVAGLVFDDLIEETIDLGPEEVLTVYSDVIEEALGFAEGDFTGNHWVSVSDWIDFQEAFGPPLRVRQSVLNVIMTTPVTPALIAHVHLDVLHGVDVFWEEVSSELQIHSSYANAVPYYWEWIFESLGIDMTEPQPRPPITLTLKLLSNDLVNMRHDVTQEYLFNSKCFEEFFIWDGIVWGWDKRLADSLVDIDSIQEIIGKVADDYIYMGDGPVPRVKVVQIIDDRVFIFDAGTHEKYYLLTAADTIDISDRLMEIFGQVIAECLILQGVPVSGVSRYITAEESLHSMDAAISERYYLCLADETVDLTDGEIVFLSINRTVAETFNASSTAVPLGIFGGLASESLTFRDIDSYIHGLVIQEGLDLGDVELARWVFNVLIESGCNAADIIA
jgi:hypothetical protein